MKFIKSLLKKNEYKLEKGFWDKLNETYDNYYDENEFVWSAKVYSFNDLEITYNKNEKKYYLNVVTAYLDDERDKSLYIQDLFEQFTQYMYDCNLSVNKELEIYDIFYDGINLVADDMETLYAQFKFLVKGYLGMNNNTI